MIYLLTVGLVSGVGLIVAFLLHQRRLGRHRGIPREQFIAAFADTGIWQEIPAVVYDYYKTQVFSKDFNIAPDDMYEQVLSKGAEDIDDDARVLIRKLGLRIPPDYASVRAERRIRTIRDIVLWLDWIHQRQSS